MRERFKEELKVQLKIAEDIRLFRELSSALSEAERELESQEGVLTEQAMAPLLAKKEGFERRLPEVRGDERKLDEKLAEANRLVARYQQAIADCTTGIAEQRNITPANYVDPVTRSLQEALSTNKFEGDERRKPTEARIARRVRDNIGHALYNISQSSFRAKLNFELDERWHKTHDRDCTMGSFFKAKDLQDGGQAIEFANPERGIENDVGGGDEEKPCREKVKGKMAQSSLSFDANMQIAPWNQSSKAIRTIDGRYHRHGISKHSLHVLEREGPRVVKAAGGSVSSRELKQAAQGREGRRRSRSPRRQPVGGTSLSPERNTKKPRDERVCYGFIKGKCRWGEQCKFAHVTGKVTQCSHFVRKGTCRYGNKCRYSHCIEVTE
jgi:hypothetical protein